MPIADFHSHTVYSRDCCTTVAEVVRACHETGITCLAVTDHNEIEGALRVRDAADFQVIVGEEIFTREGELIGLFLEERIPPRLPFRETAERVRAQGGLTYLPHPVSGIRKSRLTRQVMEDNVDVLDIVESYNARTLLADDVESRWLRDFIRRHDLVTAAASDAHSRWELGNVRVAIDDFATPTELRDRLRTARVTARPSPLWQRVVLNHRVRGALRAVKAHA